MDLKISQELAQKIMNYLVKQPYFEVAQLISELTQLKKIEEKKVGE